MDRHVATTEMKIAGGNVLFDILTPVLGYVPYGDREMAEMVYNAMEAARFERTQENAAGHGDDPLPAP